MQQGIANSTCDVLSMLEAFHSVVIDVRDFETGVEDYARLLGRRPFRVERNAARATHSALFALANTWLEVRCGDPPESAAQRRFEQGASGLAGLRLTLAESPGLLDGQTIAGLLASRGIAFTGPVREEAEGLKGAGGREWSVVRLDAGATRSIPVELIAEVRHGGAAPVLEEAAPPADPSARVRALDHVVVLSADLEATRAVYAEALGLRLALDRSFDKRGLRLLFFRLGGVTIEVGGRLDAPPSLGQGDRFGGLAWQVPDIDVARARLHHEGFDVSRVRDGHKPGTRVCTVRDPVHEVPTLLIEPV